MTRAILRAIFSVACGLFVGILVSALAGESPWLVLKVLTLSAFGSFYDFGMTLFYATPLILTGLAVAVPFRAGLFNVGAEGQLTLGALATAAVAIWFPNIPYPWAPFVAGGAGFLVGGLWGGIAGFLRAVRKNHEVITTIMLNFIAAGIASYITMYLLKANDTQNPETLPIGEAFYVHHWSLFGDAPVSSALGLALLLVIVVFVLLKRTVLGFEIEATGENSDAAQFAGISVKKIQVLTLFLGGGLAGLVGVCEVLGNAYRFRLGFSPGYGFIGIAVALLARGQPLGIIASAILFGALQKGTNDLAIETEKVSRDLSFILQALVIFSVSAEALWAKVLKPKKVMAKT